MDQKNQQILDEFLKNEYQAYKDSIRNPENIIREPIHIAAMENRLDVVQILLKNDPTFLNKKTKYNQSPLMFAAASGSLEIVKYLVGQGAELDIQDGSYGEHRGKTALHYAIEGKGDEGEEEYNEISLFLINKGANLTKTASNAQFQPIHVAAEKGRLQVVKALLQKDPNFLEASDDLGQTPVLWAASRGRTEVVKFLLEKKANLNAATTLSDEKNPEHGRTSLHWAIDGGYENIAILLIDANADLTKKAGKDKLQPIHFAAATGQLKVIKAILRKDPNSLEIPAKRADQTPFFWAASRGCTEVVKFFLEKEAHLDVLTAIHLNINSPLVSIPAIAILLTNAGEAIFSEDDNPEWIIDQFEAMFKRFQNRKEKTDPKLLEEFKKGKPIEEQRWWEIKNTPEVQRILEDIYIETTVLHRKALESKDHANIALLTATLFAIDTVLYNYKYSEDALKACLRCAEKLESNFSFGKKLAGLIFMFVGFLGIAGGFLLSVGATAATFGLAAPIAAPAGIGIAVSSTVLAAGGAFLFFNSDRKALSDYVNDFVAVFGSGVKVS